MDRHCDSLDDAVRQWDEAMAAVDTAVHDADFATLSRQARNVRRAFREVRQRLEQTGPMPLPAALRERLLGCSRRLEQLQRDVTAWRDRMRTKSEVREVTRRVTRAYHPNAASLCGRDVRIRAGEASG